MAFFCPRTVYSSQPSFTPLFHVLNSRSQCAPRTPKRNNYYVYRAPVVRPWQPRFETTETADAYMIYGELSGLSKDQISVDLPEAQKLVISGTTERREQPKPVDDAPSADQHEKEQNTNAAEVAPDATKSNEDDDADSVTTEYSKSSRSSYQATVEDADDDDEFEMIYNSSKKVQEKKQEAEEKRQPEPQRKQTVAPMQEQKQPAAATESKPTPADTTDRNVRRFSRTFTFPDSAELDYDAVTADLKDGLLRVVVPKVKRPEPRRVAINYIA